MCNRARKGTHDMNEELREGQNCYSPEREARRVGEEARVKLCWFLWALFKVFGFIIRSLRNNGL